VRFSVLENRLGGGAGAPPKKGAAQQVLKWRTIKGGLHAFGGRCHSRR